MARVYLNGEFVAFDQAQLPITDRGLLFGDGVYEVIPAYHNKPFRLQQHLKRLQRSLTAIRLDLPIDIDDWQKILLRLLQENQEMNGDNQSIYIQISRGSAPTRKHPFPDIIRPNVFALCSKLATKPVEELKLGASAITLPDMRWQNCHIKAITLLPNVLMVQQAIDQGAVEAILMREGHAIEGTSSNLFIVKDNTIITPPLSPHILGGITRELVIELAKKQGLTVLEQAIPEAELKTADEIWMTSSTKEILPILILNDKPVGAGKAGPVWQQMITAFQAYKKTL